jgi:hypothetical protein
MMDIRSAIDWIRPPELAEGSTPEARARHRNAINRYRWNVSMCVLALMAFCVWTLTDWGFARASEVDQRVQRALAPLQSEITNIQDAQTKQGAQLDKQNEILTRLSQQLKDQLITATGSQIRLLIGKRCKELDAQERERTNNEIEKLQLAYKAQTGDRLQIRCDEL